MMRPPAKQSKSLAERLKERRVTVVGEKKGPRHTLWKGPEVDGITQSMLSRFLVCRERFRLSVCEGLRTEEGFQHKMEYGNMWHVCEEHHAAGESWDVISLMLKKYCQDLCKVYTTQQEQIDKWYHVCKIQFPIYVEFWRKRTKAVKRKPLLEEKVFDCPYSLPSGRVIRLRGKWDSVHLAGLNPNYGIWLQENKTKGDIKEEIIRRQLKFDLQTMLYLVALQEWQRLDDYGTPIRTSDAVDHPIKGVLYNVVRRPLSGGKGTIVQKKGSKNIRPETKDEYYKRLQDIIVEDQASYFMRWEVSISQEDIEAFKTRFLDPMLTQLCEWWDWVSTCYEIGSDPFGGADGGFTNWLHYQHPYGVTNILNEGGSTDLDEHLATGSTVGLRKIDSLFPELA
jgi:hypothetical protein